MRTHFLPASILLLYLPAGAVDGIDMPGSDYASFNASSPAICRNSCGGDPNCRGWTWVKPGIQGPSGRCWLKNNLPRLVKNSCCNSGARENISAEDVKAEDRTDRPGSDYRNFEIDSWRTCEATCAREYSCMAWSYARAGVQGPRGRCWLKGVVPNPVENAGVVSGVKYRRPAVRFDDNQ
jgi:PAN domain-containing protein